MGDFNGDGKLDIVATSSKIITLLGNGNGTFQTPILTNYPASSQGNGTGGVVVTDINDDGKADIAVTNTRHAPS